MALKVLTFNVWGLHYLAKRVRERLGYIAEELKSYDVVALQEVWSRDDYKFLEGKLREVLPHSFHFHSGIIGSGLCIFSRYPIMSVYAHQFSVTGGMNELSDGELFAGKGVLSARIMTPHGPVLLVDAHINPRCRESQIYEITQLVSNCRGSDLVIVCGDFNTKEKHVAYSLMTKLLGLEDAFAGSTVDTCDLKSNIYTLERMTPKRIDFIFFSDDHCPSMEMEVQSKQLALTGHIPGQDFPYSDHEGVEVVFQFKERKSPLVLKEHALGDEVVAALEEVVRRIEERKAKYVTTHHWVIGTWVLLLLVSLLVSIILSSRVVLDFLVGYYMNWLAAVVMGLVGAGSIVMVITTLFNVHHMNGMDSIVKGIRTRLNYNRILLNSRNNVNHVET